MSAHDPSQQSDHGVRYETSDVRTRHIYLAGLALASTAALIAPRLAAWDASARARRGLPEAWQFE